MGAPRITILSGLNVVCVVEHAERLAAAGVGTRVIRYPGMMHTFVNNGRFLPRWI